MASEPSVSAAASFRFRPARKIVVGFYLPRVGDAWTDANQQAFEGNKLAAVFGEEKTIGSRSVPPGRRVRVVGASPVVAALAIVDVRETETHTVVLERLGDTD